MISVQVEIPDHLKLTKASRALWEDLETQCCAAVATGLGLEKFSQLMRKLAIRLAKLEVDRIYYEEDELTRRSILRMQLFLKTRLIREIVEFNIPYLELVTLKTLIASLKEKHIKDLVGLFVFPDRAIELRVP